MTTYEEQPVSWPYRLLAAAKRLHEIGRTTKYRRATLIVALALFAGGFIVSLRRLPAGVGLSAPGFLALSAFAAVPAAIILNTIETRLSAKLVGAHFGWLQAAHIGLISSAANMLPLPGGPLVRVTALRIAGAPLLKSSITTTLIAAAWLGLAFILAGTWIVSSHALVGLPLLIAGSLMTAGIAVMLWRYCRSLELLAMLLLVKIAAIFIGVLRTYWALASLGLVLHFSQVWVFSLSDVAGSAVSIVPAGLGINEAVAALMAQLVEVPPAAAFLAVSLNRVIAVPVLVAAILGISAIRKALERRPPKNDKP